MSDPTSPYPGGPHQPAPQPGPLPYGQQPDGQQTYPPVGYGPRPLDPSSERTWAAAAHWGSLVAAFLALAFLAPLVVMLTKGNESAYVRRHAVESLNFQLSLLIYSVVGGLVGVVLAFVTLGLALLVILPVVALVGVAALVLIIIASTKAGNGEDYRYPLTIRLVS